MVEINLVISSHLTLLCFALIKTDIGTSAISISSSCSFLLYPLTVNVTSH